MVHVKLQLIHLLWGYIVEGYCVVTDACNALVQGNTNFICNSLDAVHLEFIPSSQFNNHAYCTIRHINEVLVGGRRIILSYFVMIDSYLYPNDPTYTYHLDSSKRAIKNVIRKIVGT